MKLMKSLTSVGLSALMAMSLGISAFAADTTPYTITITPGDSAEHTYEAYQIFSGDLSGNVLSNVQWGAGVDGAALLVDLKADLDAFDSADCDTAAEVAEILAANPSISEKFADVVAKNLATKADDVAVTDGTAGVLNVTGAGYYFVKDQDGSLSDQAAYTDFILKVVKDITVTAKADVPSLDKKIVEGSERVDSNTASIGDTVNFEITSTVPKMEGYEKYYFVIEDTLSKGFTYNYDLNVKVNGSDADFNTYINVNDDLTTSLVIVLKDFIDYADLAGKPIVVTYSATLDEDADLSQTGNVNEADLTFSNNPNVDYSGSGTVPGVPTDPSNPVDPDTPTDDNGTPGDPSDDPTYPVDPDYPGSSDPMGETPKVNTKTYAATIEITKVDGADNTQILTGAQFQISGTALNVVLINKEIFKLDAAGTYFMLKDGTYTEVAPDAATEDAYASTTDKYAKVTVVNKATDKTEINTTGYVDSNGVISFAGLGEGTYTITELVAPEGYNLLTNPIEITISADPSLSGCEWDSDWGTVNGSVIEGKVANNAGATLPETGGVGTVMFYSFGALLTLGAALLLISKKRMEVTEK